MLPAHGCPPAVPLRPPLPLPLLAAFTGAGCQLLYLALKVPDALQFLAGRCALLHMRPRRGAGRRFSLKSLNTHLKKVVDP